MAKAIVEDSARVRRRERAGRDEAREQRAIYRALAILDRRMRRPSAAFCSPGDARTWMRLRFANCEREEFVVLFLDNKNCLIEQETISLGTIDTADVYPREIVKIALKYNAAAVLLAHNHPSGSPVPSRADREITQRISRALDLVGVRVIDHLIVGDRVLSFVEENLLPSSPQEDLDGVVVFSRSRPVVSRGTKSRKIIAATSNRASRGS